MRNKENYMSDEDGKYVYLIGPSGGPMKIGTANNVKSRRSILNVGNPKYLRIFHIEKTDNKVAAKKLENELHHHFQNSHLRGEWFDLKESELSQIKQAFNTCQLVFCVPDDWNIEKKGCDEFTPEVCRIARQAMSMSESDLANKAQISEATVRNFEKSETVANINTVEAIKTACENLGIEFIRERYGERLKVLI